MLFSTKRRTKVEPIDSSEANIINKLKNGIDLTQNNMKRINEDNNLLKSIKKNRVLYRKYLRRWHQLNYAAKQEHKKQEDELVRIRTLAKALEDVKSFKTGALKSLNNMFLKRSIDTEINHELNVLNPNNFNLSNPPFFFILKEANKYPRNINATQIEMKWNKFIKLLQQLEGMIRYIQIGNTLSPKQIKHTKQIRHIERLVDFILQSSHLLNHIATINPDLFAKIHRYYIPQHFQETVSNFFTNAKHNNNKRRDVLARKEERDAKSLK